MKNIGRIIERVKHTGAASRSEIHGHVGGDINELSKAIKSLAKAGVLIQHGKKRGTYYTLANDYVSKLLIHLGM